MDQESGEELDYGIHSNILLEMLEQFISVLDVPQTQATFKRQMNKRKTPKQEGEQEGEKACEMVDERNEAIQKQNLGQVRAICEEVKQTQQMTNEKKEQQEEKKNCNKAKTVDQQLQLSATKMNNFFKQGLSFSQILQKVQQNSKIKNKIQSSGQMVDQREEKNIESLLKYPECSPRIVKIFSAYESMKQLRKIHLPIHHTISIEPKTSRTVKFMSISPNEHFLVVVDMESNLFVYNPRTKKIVHEQKKPHPEQAITCLKWLSGDLLAIGKQNGSIDLSIICETLNQLASIKQAHSKAVLDIFQYEGFLYSIGSDHRIVKTSKRKWKPIHEFNVSISPVLKRYTFANPPVKLCKIKDQSLKNICFIMDSVQNRVWMLDQISELEREILNVDKQCKGGTITQMVAHQKSKSLLIGVSGKNVPEIYQIFPLNNQIFLRISGNEIVNQTLNLSAPKQRSSNCKSKKKSHNIYFSYLHQGQVLSYTSTTEEGKINFVSMRNWRALYTLKSNDQKQESSESKKSYMFGGVMAAGGQAGVEEQNQLLFEFDMKKSSKNANDKTAETKNNSSKDKKQQSKSELSHEIIALLNTNSGNIEVYDTEKSDLVFIRSQQEKLRRMLALGSNLPRGAEGFLTLIQNIRENYSVFF